MSSVSWDPALRLIVIFIAIGEGRNKFASRWTPVR
jgi:hypothetical protein